MMHRLLVGIALSALTLGSSATAWAVSYASGVRNVGGTNYEFVLNADASNVVVQLDSGAINMGSLTAGRHTFDLGASSTFDIEVSSNNPTGWSRISDTSNPFTWFYQANGIGVNKNPSSPYFGTIYVGNSQENTVTVPGTRLNGDGIYALTADTKGLNAGTFAEITDPDDISQVAAPGFTVAGSTFSPWDISFDEASNLIIQDYSGANGGIKYAAPNLQTGGLILAGEGGPANGEVGFNHGSIMSEVTVTGTVGNDLTVWALDQDLQTDSGGLGGQGSAGDGSSLWRWDVGSATEYAGAANLVINVSNLPTTTQGQSNFLNLNNIDVIGDAVYSPATNKWYLVERRSDADQAGLIVITPDGVDGNSPTLEWSSLQFTIDNGMDGFPGQFDFVPSDILRLVSQAEISADGTELYLNRTAISDTVLGSGIDTTNPHLGGGSNQPGSVLVIPLDENGIPIVEIDDNGTPGDTSDDLIANWDSIETTGNNSMGSRANIELDAAGNVYTTSNSQELLEVYSPGGAKKTTYSNNASLTAGDFSVEDLVLIAGDYNGDGLVNAADYTVWRDTLGSEVDLRADGNGNLIVDGPLGEDSDYGIWTANFGAGASTSTTIPEPATAMLGLIVLGGTALVRRRS